MTEAPPGRCTCPPVAQQPCDYCQAMTLWAHEQLYGHEEEISESRTCWYCGGEGWGVVGLDWDVDDAINGPYEGDAETCPCCNGSGNARDCTFW